MSKYKKEEEAPELFRIAGNQYFFDLDELSQFIRIDRDDNVDDILGQAKKELAEMKESEDIPVEGQIIDITKWETIKVMVESVLSEHAIVDEAMGITKLGEQLSIPFRLSFNTLLNYIQMKTNI